MSSTDPQIAAVLAAVLAELDPLVERCVAAAPLRVEHDPEWPSPCELGAPDENGMIDWQPVRRSAFDVLEPLAATLGVALQPSIGAYYGRYFCHGFETCCDEGPVSLLGIWSPADQDRLLQNLLGHALQQRRTKQPLTLFFACTEPDSDLILSVENASGAVVLERPGQAERRAVADSLPAFLATLRPVGAA